MAVYVIADLHLSIGAGAEKSMEVFGARWTDYTEKLRRNYASLVAEEDTVVIPGDISWAISLEEAKADFAFLHSLPGKKILMKGNHDYWWSSTKKMQDFCDKNGFDDISFLYHDAVLAENLILTGTRGWFWDGDADGMPASDEITRLTARETIRLDMALSAAEKLKTQNPNCEIVAFFHFPPVWGEQIQTPFIDRLEKAGISRVFYGHIHGAYGVPASTEYRGITFRLIAADYLSFVPYHISQR